MANKDKKKENIEENIETKPEINEVMNDLDSEIENKDQEIEVLRKENENLKKLSEELANKVKYTQAELINYRKRKDEEVEKIKKYCNQDIIVDLLPVIDNFERAVKYDDNNLEDAFSKFLSGFKIMFSDLNNVLVKYGVTPISRVGEEFDPKLEQALLTDKVDGHNEDEVLEVLLKGYMLKDRVIRPATVKINKIDE